MRRTRISAAVLAGALIVGRAGPAGPAVPAAVGVRAQDARAPEARLPVRLYTVADGLAGDEINVIMPDSRGFLWIGTDSGLSRFDGSRFVSYDPRQGLPSPNVMALAEEAGGILLAGTTGGVADLDPATVATIKAPFATAPTASAPPRGRIAMLLAADGILWAATAGPAGGGLFRLRAAAAARGAAAHGASWEEVRRTTAGMGGGTAGAPVTGVTALASGDGLWLGTTAGLLHRRADGSWSEVPLRAPPRREGIAALAADGGGRLWALATGGDLYVMRLGPAAPGSATSLSTAGTSLFARAAGGRCGQADAVAPRLPEAPDEVCRFELTSAPRSGRRAPRPRAAAGGADDPASRLAAPSTARPGGALLRTRDGTMWIATAAGLAKFDGRRFRVYTGANGLPRDVLTALGEDRDGNLWVGTRSRGVLRIANGGFLNFGTAGDPHGIDVAQVFEDRRSNLYVWGATREGPWLAHFDGERLQDVTPKAMAAAGGIGRGRRQSAAVDADGGLWLGGVDGIWRIHGAADARSLHGAAAEWLPLPPEMGTLYRLFGDSRGSLWLSSLGSEAGGAGIHVARWDGTSRRFVALPRLEDPGGRGAGGAGGANGAGVRGRGADGAGDGVAGAPSAFAEDARGNVWIGYAGGTLARVRGGALDLAPDLVLAGDRGVPHGAVTDLHVDAGQRLWVATAYGGVLRLDDLDAPRPRVTAYTTAQGLASDRIVCVTEDRRGMIYLGHGRGVDQLDPRTGGVRMLGLADGLPASLVTSAYQAGDGSLWFGTPAGPARFLPEAPHAEAPPPILLSELRIGGRRQPLPPLGARHLAGFELPAGRNQVEVHFIGISFASGAGLRYQYRQEGTAAGWSEPQAERSVVLADLAPGSYRFLFRALTPGGVASQAPASLSFTLPRPVWQRWWFALLVAAAAMAAAWALHQARLRRIVELERVRMRIAADLHDDLSSSLSRVSILSELARRQVDGPESRAAALLDQIGDTARELMEATGDIVWAIDARHDDLESVLVRIRRFAGDLLEGKGVQVFFAAPERAAEIPLTPEARRELYLVLKEAVHNAARHARARQVRIEVAAAGGELMAEVRDDGVGFAAGAAGSPVRDGASAGNGLRNIRERAAKLGARLSVDSAPGAGTRVRLSLRL